MGPLWKSGPGMTSAAVATEEKNGVGRRVDETRVARDDQFRSSGGTPRGRGLPRRADGVVQIDRIAGLGWLVAHGEADPVRQHLGIDSENDDGIGQCHHRFEFPWWQSGTDRLGDGPELPQGHDGDEPLRAVGQGQRHHGTDAHAQAPEFDGQEIGPAIELRPAERGATTGDRRGCRSLRAEAPELGGEGDQPGHRKEVVVRSRPAEAEILLG